MHGSVNQKASFYGGYRVGFDYDFYWGLEARLGASSICLSEPARIGQPGTNDYWNLDMNLHYYPLGRQLPGVPYASFGMGMANFAFYDQNNNHYDQVEFATPIGIGLKYRWTNWVAFRADLMDNIAYAPRSGRHDEQHLADCRRGNAVRRSAAELLALESRQGHPLESLQVCSCPFACAAFSPPRRSDSIPWLAKPCRSSAARAGCPLRGTPGCGNFEGF